MSAFITVPLCVAFLLLTALYDHPGRTTDLTVLHCYGLVYVSGMYCPPLLLVVLEERKNFSSYASSETFITGDLNLD